MALQDLTPELRTRLGRVERWVGLFVGLAGLLLLAGFCYYLFHTAQRKGWFLKKVPYYIYVRDASGLKAGDPVKLMGFEVGEITEVTPMPPTEWFVQNHYNVFVRFLVKEPNYGYIWTDSDVRVNAADLLGNRGLEVTKGQTGVVTVVEQNGVITGILSEHVQDSYVPLTRESKGVWLTARESPPVADKLEQIVRAVEAIVPGLTNQLAAVLANSSQASSNLNLLVLDVRPVATNLAEVTGRLRDFDGALGRWMFSADVNRQIGLTLTNAGSALATADTNLVRVADRLTEVLDHLSGITSNLNVQVQANTNLVSSVSDSVKHLDELVQGLKGHWLLRSAFREKERSTNAPAPPKGATRLQEGRRGAGR